jgi:hypothetical protein
MGGSTCMCCACAVRAPPPAAPCRPLPRPAGAHSNGRDGPATTPAAPQRRAARTARLDDRLLADALGVFKHRNGQVRGRELLVGGLLRELCRGGEVGLHLLRELGVHSGGLPAGSLVARAAAALVVTTGSRGRAARRTVLRLLRTRPPRLRQQQHMQRQGQSGVGAGARPRTCMGAARARAGCRANSWTLRASPGAGAAPHTAARLMLQSCCLPRSPATHTRTCDAPLLTTELQRGR